MKKVISLLLALVMALSLLPAAVWAEGESAAAPAEEVSDSFFDSSHPFTWNDGSYVWRFWWNGPDGSRGEWHLYAAPEGTSADSADGWTDCGAEATPFEHLTEGTLAPVSCMENGQCSCDRTQDCRTKPIWTELDNLIQNYLESVTLAAFLTPHLS